MSSAPQGLVDYSAAAAASLPFVEAEHRRGGHRTLRALAAQLAASPLDVRAATSSVAALLGLLWPPADAALALAPLPLPHASPPPSAPVPFGPPAPMLLMLQPELAAPTRSPPALAQDCTAPPLASPLRSEHAFRAAAAAAAGAVTSDATSAAAAAVARVERLGADGVGAVASGMLGWALQAPIALAILEDALIARGELRREGRWLAVDAEESAQLECDVLVHVSHFLGFAPWTYPDAHVAAERVLAALLWAEVDGSARPAPAPGPNSTPTPTPLSALRPLHMLVARHATFLLEFCRVRSVGGRWRSERGLAPVRYLALLAVTSLRAPALSAELLALCLPLGLRLCDDAEPGVCWTGASMLAHCLRNALPGDLRSHAFCAPLVRECLLRARVAGGARAHPSVTLALAHCTALALVALSGPAPALRGGSADVTSDAVVALLRASQRRGDGRGGDPAESNASALDSDWDAAVGALLRQLALAPSSHVQYAALEPLCAPLCLLLGARLARHLPRLVAALARLAAESSDARVCCAALHSLCACALSAPRRFAVSAEEDGGGECEEGVRGGSTAIDAQSRAQLVDCAIAACVAAATRARREELVLPAVDADGVMAWRHAVSGRGGGENDSGDEEEAGARVRVRGEPSEAARLVASYARAAVGVLALGAPSFVRRRGPEMREALRSRGEEGRVDDLAIEDLGL